MILQPEILLVTEEMQETILQPVDQISHFIAHGSLRLSRFSFFNFLALFVFVKFLSGHLA